MKVNTLEERVGNRKWHIIEDGEPQHLQYQEGTWFKTEGLSGKYKADRSTAAPDSSYDVDSWKMQDGYEQNNPPSGRGNNSCRRFEPANGAGAGQDQISSR